MFVNYKYLFLMLPLTLVACTSMPSSPSIMVLPGSGKTFDQFRSDDLLCRQFAESQLGTNANQTAINSGVQTAAIGTTVGAASGALINGGHGAAVGAGVGLLTGSIAGASTGNITGYQAQVRYDHAYQQCMYSRGNSIPVTTRYSQGTTQNTTPKATNYGPPPNTQNPPPSRYIVPGK